MAIHKNYPRSNIPVSGLDFKLELFDYPNAKIHLQNYSSNNTHKIVSNMQPLKGGNYLSANPLFFVRVLYP